LDILKASFKKAPWHVNKQPAPVRRTAMFSAYQNKKMAAFYWCGRNPFGHCDQNELFYGGCNFQRLANWGVGLCHSHGLHANRSYCFKWWTGTRNGTTDTSLQLHLLGWPKFVL
jgi:hypothetical protein